jgi:hypothetical protein
MTKSAGVAIAAVLTVGVARAAEVKVVPDEAKRRVDVTVDGKPFTAYVWPERLKKPVLYPLRTARGTLVTRGWPLDPRPGERVDHPHQVGMWFNYGDVDGFDFWGNSEAIKPEQQAKMGAIRHRRVVAARGGKDRGELEVEADWVVPSDRTILRERTRFVFRAAPGLRVIDRITTLSSTGAKVVFNDTKEGAFGIRVARALEQPSNTPEVFTDASGRPTTVPALDNKGVSGAYLSSEARKGDAVWGTRGRWVTLSGTVEGEPVTLAILDHPSNAGFPTYWHARGYGLFAANTFGQKVFSEGKETLNYTIPAGGSATFRYRVLIASETLAPDQVEQQFKDFTSTAP